MKLPISVAFLVVAGFGCAPDPCSGQDDPVVRLGQGVGGAFEELEDEQEVSLAVAPQGGFGVAVVMETAGLSAGDEEIADVELNTEIDGELTGTFLLEDAPLLCKSDGTGGTISGVVVGFDPDVYRSNDDLLALDGEVVDLVVTVTDGEGRSTVATKPVTTRVGG
jgi:hypothetical protein